MTKRISVFLSIILPAAILGACGSSPTPSPTNPPADTASPSARTGSTETPDHDDAYNRCHWVKVYRSTFSNKVLTPQSTAQISWKLYNVGYCPWTSDYQLVFDHGDQMGAPDSLPLTTETVAPGESVWVSITLTAPEAEGVYEGFFMLRAPDGTTFGTGPNADAAWGVAITVLTSTAIAQTKVAESILIPTPTPQLDRSSSGCNVAEFVADITAPDGWEIGAQVFFAKTWRIKNIGTCTWTPDYELVFVDGDRMGALSSPLTIGRSIEPGAEIDLSVDLISPQTNGIYQGFFMLQPPDGLAFGIGSDSRLAFWVKIEVTGGLPAPETQYISGPNVPTCPPGWVATGGGFVASPGVDIFHNWRQGNSWVVNPRPGSDDLPTAMVICLKLSGVRVDHITTYEKTPTTDSVIYSSDCPSDSLVTSGGYYVKENGTIVRQTIPKNNGWQITAVHEYDGWGPSLQLSVECLSNVYAVTFLTAATVEIPPGAIGYAEAVCPTGKFLLGGGWNFLADLDVFSAVWYSGKWRVSARNNGSQTQFLEAHAVCLGGL
jgi:hypothetical protein